MPGSSLLVLAGFFVVKGSPTPDGELPVRAPSAEPVTGLSH
jgi:hypothetical protein